MAPTWQSRCLLAAALLALAAVEIGAAAYAFQSASRAQILTVGGVVIHTDVALKTAMSIAAGLALALGPVIAIHKWRTGRKGARREAVLAGVACLVGLVVSTSNLSGYFAWTRGQLAVEQARTNPLYRVAAANAEAVVQGRAAYITGADRRILAAGLGQATAVRDGGDVMRALGILLLVSGMATAYRLPGEPRAPAKRRRKPRDIRGKLKVIH